MAKRVPNLKYLNLNYNFLVDLDGLQGLTRLKKLTVVGARLGGSGTRGVVRGLKGLTNIEEIDLRYDELYIIIETELIS
jgi:hypothetical protein